MIHGAGIVATAAMAEARRSDPRPLAVKNAVQAGPVRTRLFWTMPGETPELAGFGEVATFAPHADALQTIECEARFLCAIQGPVSRLWSVVPAIRYYDAAHGWLEQYGTPARENLTFMDMLGCLSDFELAMVGNGVRDDTEQSLAKLPYFKDFAVKEGIVFDVRTGRPTILLNGLVPEQPGTYAPQEIKTATEAFAAAAQDKQGNTLGKLFAPYYFDVDVHKTCAEVAEIGNGKALCKHYGEAVSILSNASSRMSFSSTEYGYDYSRTVDNNKQFNRLLGNMQKIAQTMQKCKQTYNLGIVTEALLLLELTRDILQIRIQAFELQKDKGATEAAQQALVRDIQDTKLRYDGRLSPENVERIGSLALNYSGHDLMIHIRDVQQKLNDVFGTLEAQHSARFSSRRL